MTRHVAVLIAMILAVGCSSQRPAPRFEPTSAALEQRDRPVSSEDLRILDRADELLSDASRWDRTDDRTCPPDASRYSLFCALQKASIEVLGRYEHRRVSMQEVRFAVEDVSGGREFEHRLMDFNNLDETTFADIKKVLSIARQRVTERLGSLALRQDPLQ